MINSKCVTLHHDNARFHASITTKNLINKFGCKTLIHLPNSLIVPQWIFFRSMLNYLWKQKLTSRKKVDVKVVSFFIKTKIILGESIRKHMGRWEEDSQKLYRWLNKFLFCLIGILIFKEKWNRTFAISDKVINTFLIC